MNTIRYLARSGGGWRMLPEDFPPWPTVYWWFRRFVRRFLFQTIHDVALMLDRERVGREVSPTALPNASPFGKILPVHHQRHGCVLEHMARNTAQDQLTEARVGIGTHYE
jgi:transposase